MAKSQPEKSLKFNLKSLDKEVHTLEIATIDGFEVPVKNNNGVHPGLPYVADKFDFIEEELHSDELKLAKNFFERRGRLNSSGKLISLPYSAASFVNKFYAVLEKFEYKSVLRDNPEIAQALLSSDKSYFKSRDIAEDRDFKKRTVSYYLDAFSEQYDIDKEDIFWSQNSGSNIYDMSVIEEEGDLNYMLHVFGRAEKYSIDNLLE